MGQRLYSNSFGIEANLRQVFLKKKFLFVFMDS